MKNTILEEVELLVGAIRWVCGIPFLGEFEVLHLPGAFQWIMNSAELQKVPLTLSQVHQRGKLDLPVIIHLNPPSEIPIFKPRKIKTIQKAIDGHNLPLAHRYLAMAYEAKGIRQSDAVIVMLATAAEIGIKEFLSGKDVVLCDTLRDIPSPPINKLVSVARNHFGLKIDKKEGEILQNLARCRNDIVHSTKRKKIDTNKVRKWFKVVTKLLNTAYPPPK